MSDLVQLSRRFVELNGELEEIRRQMLKALSNGAAPESAHPFDKAPRPGKGKPHAAGAASAKPYVHPNAIKFAAASETVLTQLRLKPCSTKEIAAATRTSTTVERLRRLTERGLVQRDAGGLYSAA